MYQIGDLVVYGIHGVCRIVDMEKRIVDRKPVTYLAAEPVAKSDSRFLIPTHNAAAMAKLRPMLSTEAWQGLLQSDEIHEKIWIGDDGRRKAAYRELLSGGDLKAQLRMLCSVYAHKERTFAEGKKFHQCDDTFLRDAERLIAGEIAVVMDIPHTEALAYLRSYIKKTDT